MRVNNGFRVFLLGIVFACMLGEAAGPGPASNRRARTVRSQAGTTQYLDGFAQIAYGSWTPGGYWKTTFVFRNEGTTEAGLTLRFFGDHGEPLLVPVLGGQRAPEYTITIPGGGARDIVLDPSNDALTVGWAAVDADYGLKGQGIFTQHVPGGRETEAVVSMVSLRSASCIIPLPTTTSYSMPFDNTDGRVSSYAFANTSSATVTLRASFFGSDGEALGEIIQEMPPFGHIALASSDRLPSVGGKKGTMRITGEGIIPLGFRFSGDSFTTWLEQ